MRFYRIIPLAPEQPTHWHHGGADSHLSSACGKNVRGQIQLSNAVEYVTCLECRTELIAQVLRDQDRLA